MAEVRFNLRKVKQASPHVFRVFASSRGMRSAIQRREKEAISNLKYVYSLKQNTHIYIAALVSSKPFILLRVSKSKSNQGHLAGNDQV